jgi:hypothetical protein
VFDQSNIQSRPLVELFQKPALVVRTWLNDARAGMAIADAKLELVVMDGQAVSPDTALVDLGLTDAVLLAVIFDGQEPGADEAFAGVGISNAELLSVIFDGQPLEAGAYSSASAAMALADAHYWEVVSFGTPPAMESLESSISLKGAIYEPA